MYENENDPGKYTQTSEKSVTGGRIDRLTEGRDQSTSRLTVPAGGSDNNQVCIYTTGTRFYQWGDPSQKREEGSPPN